MVSPPTARPGITVCLFCLAFTGCTPVYIRPPAVVPLLAEKGNVHVAATGGTDGAGVQAAVAATDALGLLALGSVDPTGDDQHAYGEGGLGFFVPFDIGRFEVYSGLGAGVSEARSGDDNAEGWYLRPFAQMTLGLSTDVFDIGASVRGAMVHYSFSEIDGVQVDQTETAFFFEPTGFMRLGYRQFKLEAQVGFASPNPGRPLEAETLHVSFGLRGFFY